MLLVRMMVTMLLLQKLLYTSDSSSSRSQYTLFSLHINTEMKVCNYIRLQAADRQDQEERKKGRTGYLTVHIMGQDLMLFG